MRVRGATCVLLEARGTDAVRDEMSVSGYERVQDHVEVIPHALDGALVAPSAHGHPEREELPSRSAGSRGTGRGVKDARRFAHIGEIFTHSPATVKPLDGEGPRGEGTQAGDCGEAGASAARATPHSGYAS